MNIIDQIKTFVEEECKKPTSNYGYEPFPHHFVPMVAYAKQLTDKLGGDKEVIEIAGRLHDI
jgi:HD superfamily phosphodiesterase